MEVSNDNTLAVAVSAQRRLHQLETLWGRAGIGLALFHAYHSGEASRSALDISVMAGVSEDTARRDLAQLASIGRVELTKSGRTTLYACPPRLAERTLAILSAEPVAA